MKRSAFRIDLARFSEASFSSRIRWWHGLLLAVVFSASVAVAQSGAAQASSPLQTLMIWVPFILKGFSLNLLMSFIAMAVATFMGAGLGLLQVSRTPLLRIPAWLLTHIFRNSPWLVILFVVIYLVPLEIRLPGGISVPIPDWVKATFAFSLPVAANISEILRGAINSIPKGQWESAESLAFTHGQTLRSIILPQCVRRCIPSWMNWYALLALATPMASILGVREAVGNAQAALVAAGSRPELLIPFYFFLLCLFFVYIYPIALWTRKLEQKYGFAN